VEIYPREPQSLSLGRIGSKNDPEIEIWYERKLGGEKGEGEGAARKCIKDSPLNPRVSMTVVLNQSNLRKKWGRAETR